MNKFIIILLILFNSVNAYADTWKITAYCPCKKCCGPQAKGITASGKKAQIGMIALNWLPFGTRAKIKGKVYVVEDRGAKSLFGTKKNHIKHIDIFMNTHQEARNFGVQYLDVERIK